MITALERFSQLVDKEGFLTVRGSHFIEGLVRVVNENTPASGSGSPEGVVIANPGKLYWDTAGGAGSILYVKKTGTGDTGWILV